MCNSNLKNVCQDLKRVKLQVQVELSQSVDSCKNLKLKETKQYFVKGNKIVSESNGKQLQFQEESFDDQTQKEEHYHLTAGGDEPSKNKEERVAGNYLYNICNDIKDCLSKNDKKHEGAVGNSKIEAKISYRNVSSLCKIECDQKKHQRILLIDTASQCDLSPKTSEDKMAVDSILQAFLREKGNVFDNNSSCMLDRKVQNQKSVSHRKNEEAKTKNEIGSCRSSKNSECNAQAQNTISMITRSAYDSTQSVLDRLKPQNITPYETRSFNKTKKHRPERIEDFCQTQTEPVIKPLQDKSLCRKNSMVSSSKLKDPVLNISKFSCSVQHISSESSTSGTYVNSLKGTCNFQKKSYKACESSTQESMPDITEICFAKKTRFAKDEIIHQQEGDINKRGFCQQLQSMLKGLECNVNVNGEHIPSASRKICVQDNARCETQSIDREGFDDPGASFSYSHKKPHASKIKNNSGPENCEPPQTTINVNNDQEAFFSRKNNFQHECLPKNAPKLAYQREFNDVEGSCYPCHDKKQPQAEECDRTSHLDVQVEKLDSCETCQNISTLEIIYARKNEKEIAKYVAKDLRNSKLGKNMDSQLRRLQDDVKDLEKQLKESISRQQQAMEEALYLSEKNKTLEEQLQNLTQVASDIEKEKNSKLKACLQRTRKLEMELEVLCKENTCIKEESEKFRCQCEFLEDELKKVQHERNCLQEFLASVVEINNRLNEKIQQYEKFDNKFINEQDKRNDC